MCTGDREGGEAEKGDKDFFHGVEWVVRCFWVWCCDGLVYLSRFQANLRRRGQINEWLGGGKAKNVTIP